MALETYKESFSKFWKKLTDNNHSSRIEGYMDPICLENTIRLTEESKVKKYELPVDYWDDLDIKSRFSIGTPTVESSGEDLTQDFLQNLEQGKDWFFDDAGVYVEENSDAVEYEAQISIKDNSEPPLSRKISFKGELKPDTELADKLL